MAGGQCLPYPRHMGLFRRRSNAASSETASPEAVKAEALAQARKAVVDMRRVQAKSERYWAKRGNGDGSISYDAPDAVD
jgi:hypothetical protein